MKKTKERKIYMLKNKNKANNGITLIALVITIIVLLILVGVTIATLTGDNGVLTKANEADIETRVATVEERKNLWKTDQKADNYLGEDPTQELAELLDNLEEEKLITPEERNQIEEKGHVVIGSKDISFSDGLTEASYTITSSLDEVIFNKIITEGDIAVEKPGFESYEIEGITKTKEEEADTNPKEGKSGILEVVGDISDATFKYTLTDFMQGDETFYCKINIDGEEYYKEINVIQGDIVTYEEDFVGIAYAGTWEEEQDENFSNNKAKKAIAQNDVPAQTASFSYYGKGFDIKTKVDSNVTVLITKKRGENRKGLICGIQHIETEYSNLTSKMQDTSFFSDDTSENTQIELLLTTAAGEGGNFYIDAIVIYK